VIKINDYQKNRFAQKIIKALGGDLEGKKITILGWAFKPNTNDSRESPAIEVTKILFDAGAIIDIYDPLIKSQKIIDDIKTNWNISIDFKKIKILKNLLEIDRDTKAIAVISECESFKKIDFSKYRLFEARNFLRELNPKS
jgi:UDPglucose 6-dehydrogenase